MPPKAKKIELPTSEDFQNAVDLLALYSDADNRLKELEAEANGELLQILDDKKPEYARWQETLAKCESGLEILARKHPDWFSADKRSIKTPYGTIKLHSSTKLEVKNEELSIVLIQQELERQLATTGAANKPEFEAAKLLRTRTELNLEALEALDDATLKRFRIDRVKKDNFSVSPAKLDMGKAVAESLKTEKAAA